MKRQVSRIANGALPLACALALPLLGCGGAPKQKAEGPGSEPAKRTAIRQVKVTTAESGSLRQTVAVSGTLAADQQVELGFKVAGRIEQMPVDLGSPVRQGQPIARLAQRDFELRVA
ncbi:MAG TPA: biotin/lipoyl-binding protein, partial [Thermoanaerobaculia bacterium]